MTNEEVKQITTRIYKKNRAKPIIIFIIGAIIAIYSLTKYPTKPKVVAPEELTSTEFDNLYSLKKNYKKNFYEELEKAVGYDKAFKIKNGIIWMGMAQNEAILTLGKPKDINTTVTKYGTDEQWVYKNNTYLYFTDGVLKSWQY